MWVTLLKFIVKNYSPGVELFHSSGRVVNSFFVENAPDNLAEAFVKKTGLKKKEAPRSCEGLGKYATSSKMCPPFIASDAFYDGGT